MSLPKPTVGVELVNANNVGVYLEQGGIEYRLGLAQSVSCSEDFELQPWQVMGRWGNAGYFSAGYRGSLTLGVFIPIKKVGPFPDGGQLSAHDIDWTREDAQLEQKPLIIDKLILRVNTTNEVLNIFEQVMLASHSVSYSSGQPVMSNMQFNYVSRYKPKA